MNLSTKCHPESVLTAVSEISGYSPDEIVSSKRGNSITAWRHIGMFVARQRGMTLDQVGKLFGKHYTSVSFAERKVERKMNDTVRRAIEAVNNKVDNEPKALS
tara:strand:- start:250 stop:558 length:309 start_codon:yes stop_codon:yes gene_type:complete